MNFYNFYKAAKDESIKYKVVHTIISSLKPLYLNTVGTPALVAALFTSTALPTENVNGQKRWWWVEV